MLAGLCRSGGVLQSALHSVRLKTRHNLSDVRLQRKVKHIPASSMTEGGLLQVWKELTERICSKLHALEEAAPPNPDQQSERQLRPGHADAHIEKQDPVLPEH